MRNDVDTTAEKPSDEQRNISAEQEHGEVMSEFFVGRQLTMTGMRAFIKTRPPGYPWSKNERTVFGIHAYAKEGDTPSMSLSIIAKQSDGTTVELTDLHAAYIGFNGGLERQRFSEIAKFWHKESHTNPVDAILDPRIGRIDELPPDIDWDD